MDKDAIDFLVKGAAKIIEMQIEAEGGTITFGFVPGKANE